MVSVADAQELVLRHSIPASSGKVSISQSVGRILCEDIIADRNFPPFDRVMMDGIAVHSDQLKRTDTFQIEGVQAAGQPRRRLLQEENCVEVMTGAILPEGTDAVVPYEELTIINGTATITTNSVERLQHVHQVGTDAVKGQILIPKGRVLDPGKVGVMAAVGVSEVCVAVYPKIVICSTGDELVGVSEVPLPHQIRNSNAYMLQAALSGLGIASETIHIADDKDQIKAALSELLGSYGVLMFSGAVSKGKFDFLPEVLLELGLDKKIHGVAQRPGKPFLFGQLDKSIIFGFPGNPASTLVCFHTYFKPWLYQHLGVELKEQKAELTVEIVFEKALTYHVLVTIESENGKILATPVPHSGSGDLIQLSMADGFLSLPAHIAKFEKGNEYPLTLFRP